MSKEIYEQNVKDNDGLINVITFALNNFTKPRVIETYIKAYIDVKHFQEDNKNESQKQ